MKFIIETKNRRQTYELPPHWLMFRLAKAFGVYLPDLPGYKFGGYLWFDRK